MSSAVCSCGGKNNAWLKYRIVTLTYPWTKVSTLLIDIAMAVNKPRILIRQISKIRPMARATSTPVSEVLCRTEL